MEFPYWGASQFSKPPYYHHDDPEEQVNDIISNGGTMFNPAQNYMHGIEICKRYGFHKKEAILHCRISKLYLCGGLLEKAMQEANTSILLDPDYTEGFIYLAEIHKQMGELCLQNGYGYEIAQCHNLNCIENYMISYDKSGKTMHATACLAICIAIDQGNIYIAMNIIFQEYNYSLGITNSLLLEKKLSSHECGIIIKFMATWNGHWLSRHMNHLVVKSVIPGSGVASACDLAGFSWDLLVKMKDFEERTMQAIISLGGVITKRDVRNIVSSVNGENIAILKLAIGSCTPSLSVGDLESLSIKALKNKKFQYVYEISLHGVSTDPALIVKEFGITALNNMPRHAPIIKLLRSTPDGCIQLYFCTVNKGELDLAEDCLKQLSKEEIESKIDISLVLESATKGIVTFVKNILERGVCPNGMQQQNHPLDVILKSPDGYCQDKMQLLSLLIEHGAGIQHCKYPRKEQTTLLHIATKFAIESGDPSAIKLLQVVCEYFPYENYEDGKIQDKNENTPFHMVMERKRSPNTIKICEILAMHYINPNTLNNRGRKPGGEKKDQQGPRYQIMQKAALKFQSHDSKKKKNGKKKNKSRSFASPDKQSSEKENPTVSSATTDRPDSPKKESDPDLDPDEIFLNVKEMVQNLKKEPSAYFEPPPSYKRQESAPHASVVLSHQMSKDHSLPDQAAENDHEFVQDQDEHINNDIKDVDVSDIAKNFEGCSWEVECTDKVKKFFANSKVHLKEKKAVVKKIQRIADGIPLTNPKICKEVRSGTKQLFETRYGKGERIIWEIAVQFSPRLTRETTAIKDHEKEYFYSEVIRLWDIVRDHGNLNRSIDQVVENIKKSQARGKTAAFQTPLKMGKNGVKCTPGQEMLRHPQYYVCSDSKSSLEEAHFIPAGSTRDDEYNVTVFYSFNSSFVKSMLDGDNARRDFPFKEWPKEHDIISMPQGETSILLLGRSGTGKTTCCLYRLWNQFQTYWLRAIKTGPFIRQRPLVILQDREETTTDDSEADGLGENLEDQCRPDTTEHSVDVKNGLSSISNVEHFHQIFITKNYVLCAQMKKRFYDMAASREMTANHMQYEEMDIPSSFTEVEDFAYPLFLTARQFFILLDNSLNDRKNFFPRDGEGKLNVKIVSSDYDHEDPDTLLDLEESDNEGEDQDDDSDVEDEISQPQPIGKKKLPERIEVTASYFSEKIWPKISKNITLKDAKIDPLLVWMEIKSFIKGSVQAMETEDGYLSQEAYQQLGKKMAPNYTDKREDIYKIFELYFKYIKHHCEDNVFDECDLNHNIHSRLNVLEDLPWSIHSIYVDEVQDFTQSELSLLIRICRDPNDLFLTGDTAQSIMRGISFRFSDLRHIFYRASKQALKAIKAVPVKVPKIHDLAINFRSHTGVLKLATSVIEVMKKYFPSSFDILPGDEGMFPGPTPIVLDSCNVSDLALVLRSNKRESSTIEFGAHQVIIVQSEEAKKNIPDVLKSGIILTVFESKGLEFDDVLLYDFFKYSKVNKEWRVITGFLEDNYPDLCADGERFFDKNPRRLEFDESQHKSLNAELKYLYTAITRAKCNLWIYDSDTDKRLPIFDYWKQRGLVKIIRIGDDVKTEDQSTLFSATSSKEEWKLQGDYFKKKRLWEPAMKCYQKAEAPYLESEARAYSLAQQVRSVDLKPDEIQLIYMKAAYAFLKCDASQHDYQCLENAAKCLKNAKTYSESSQLFALLGQNKKALRDYKRTKVKNVEVLVEMKDRVRDYDGAIRLLLKHKRIADALKYAAKYESANISISKCHQVSVMANQYAKANSKPDLLKSEEAIETFEAVMGYLPPVDQESYFKAAGMHERACEALISEGKFEEVYRVYEAQGWYDEGIQLAKKMRNRENEALFIMFKAAEELHQGEKLTKDTADGLKKKMGFQTDIEVKVTLIYGMALRGIAKIRMASTYYSKNNNPIGCVEAFHIATAKAKYNEESNTWINILLDSKGEEDWLELALHACKQIQTIVNALRATDPTPPQREIANQIERFYGLRKELGKEVYHIPIFSYPWTNQLLEEGNILDTERDPEGMILLGAKKVHEYICNRLSNFVDKWIVNDELKMVERFSKTLSKFPFHPEIVSGGYLTKSYYKSLNLIQYLSKLASSYKVAVYGNTQISGQFDIIQAVRSALSPQATCYMKIPAFVFSEQLYEKLIEVSSNVLGSNDRNFNFNDWLEAWRINCITRKGHKQMKEVLIRRSQKYTLSWEENYPVYVCDVRSGQYHHLMLKWLNACDAMREKHVLASSTVAVHSILRHVASDKFLRNTVSVSNLLNVVTIHTTAMLTMNAACLVHSGRPGNYYLPSSYRCAVEIFRNMNNINVKKSDDFFKSCIESAWSDFVHLQHKLLKLLTIILEVMIGKHTKDFNPLRYALSEENCQQNHEAHHCLMFVLTLFGNIGLLNCPDRNLQEYQLLIYESVRHCEVPVLKQAYEKFATSATIVGSFTAVKDLLEDSNDTLDHINLRINPKYNDVAISFNPAVLMNIHQRRIQPILDSTSRPSQPVMIRRSTLRVTAVPFYPSYAKSVVEQQEASIPPVSSPPAAPQETFIPPESIPESLPEQSEDMMEDDEYYEDVGEVLELEQQITPDDIAPNAPIEDDPMVRDNLCCICAVAYISDASKATTQGDSISETYSDHCRSEQHNTNSELYKLFYSEEKDYYSQKAKYLSDLLSQCKDLNKDVRDTSLHITIEAIEVGLKCSEKELQNIRNSADWRQGTLLLQGAMSGRLDFIQMKAERQIEKTKQEKADLEKDKKLQAQKEEQEEMELEIEEEDETIANTNVHYGENEKIKKRKGKKTRKNKKN